MCLMGLLIVRYWIFNLIRKKQLNMLFFTAEIIKMKQERCQEESECSIREFLVLSLCMVDGMSLLARLPGRYVFFGNQMFRRKGLL